jgi:hypothetical protein
VTNDWPVSAVLATGVAPEGPDTTGALAIRLAIGGLLSTTLCSIESKDDRLKGLLFQRQAFFMAPSSTFLHLPGLSVNEASQIGHEASSDATVRAVQA